MDEYQNFINLTNLNEIEKYLKLGYDINYQNNKGMSLLLKAIIDKDLDRMNYLLEHNATPNRFRGDISYLLNATITDDDIYEINRYLPRKPEIEKKCFDSIKLLLKYGANLELESRRGDTLLNHTAMRGDLIMAQFLILQGADYKKINWADTSGDFSPIKEDLLDFIENLELNQKLNSTLQISNQKNRKESKL